MKNKKLMVNNALKIAFSVLLAFLFFAVLGQRGASGTLATIFSSVVWPVVFIFVSGLFYLMTMKIEAKTSAWLKLILALVLTIAWAKILFFILLDRLVIFGAPVGQIFTAYPWFFQAASLSIIFGFVIWKGWIGWFKKETINLPDWSVWVVFAFSFLLYGILSIQRHQLFRSFTMDLAGYDQGMYLLSRFQTPSSSIYHFPNLLGDHFEPILAVVALLYRIWSDVRIALVAQAVAVSVTVFPIFGLAKKYLKNNLAAVLLSLSFVFFIGTQDALEFDFHPLVFAVPALAYAIYFLDAKKYWGYFISLISGFLCKEVFAVYAVFIGLYALIKKNYKIGLITILLGISWYILAVKCIIPHLSGRPYAHIGAFHDLGGSAGEIIKTIVTRPFYTLRIMLTPSEKIATGLGLLGSAAFLCFLAPAQLVLLLPMLGEKFLTLDRSSNWAMWWHYGITIAPVIIFSAIIAITKITAKKNDKAMAVSLSAAVLFATLLVAFVYYGKPPYTAPTAKTLTKKFYSVSSHLKVVEDEIKRIPQDASVITQDQIGPHLSQRKTIYQLKNFSDIEKADYVVLDEAIGHWPYGDEEFSQMISDLKKNQDFELVENNETLYIFKRR